MPDRNSKKKTPDPGRLIASEPSSPESKPGTGNGQAGGKTTAGAPNRNGLFGFITVVLLIVMMVMFLSYSQSGNRVTFNELMKHVAAQDLVPNMPVLVRDDAIIAEIQQPESRSGRQTVIVQMNSATRELYVKQLQEAGVEMLARAPSPWFQLLIFFGPVLLIMLLIWMMVSRGLRGAAGGAGMLGNFGKSRHQRLTKEMTGVTFKDVAGIDEAKDEVKEIIEFLRNPKKFTRLGGRIPRGVLLIGDPGCGKTLLAKAIAGEADVPFFSISGSDFVEMFVGVGASRVRDLFKQAKESAPCIIFLDEIDAVGRRRGGGFSGGGNDEREQTLNAILVEMDGFTSSDGVIVIAATNRGDVLDPALTRPGRFDRQITVPLPDLKGRLEILKVHAKKVKLGEDVDLEKIARGTPMFSGADLAAIINEGAIAATMQNKDFIEHEDLEEARDKVKFGRARKSRNREKEENKLVAYHEAGHAVLQALLKDADPLHKVTIIPRGSAGGATFSLPEKDRMGYSKKWLLATMRVTCGGRIAEERAMGDVSSGASQDIMQATQLARTMILDWGMSPKLGFVRYAPLDTREMFLPEKDYSEDTARTIDQEVRQLIDDAYRDAEEILDANWDKVVAVAEALLKHETLTADEVQTLMRGERLDKPSVVDLLEAETRNARDRTAPRGSDGQTDFPPDVIPSPA
ncbi:MAG: ATP-dependent zinc metalloprotease FtsH [Phycisphaerales bacterium]|nr:ATP-dependent zinc metalloprotease FtsH [Phycisphaerales bacterium]